MRKHDMRNPVNCRIRRLSEQGRKAARVRWDKESQRRRKLDDIDPIRVGGRIVRRIVVIDNERRVKERCFYEFDLERDWRRKMKEVLVR